MTKRIIISGASGLIGQTLVRELRQRGYETARLVRSQNTPSPDAIFWDPQRRVIDPNQLEGACAVIHLAGASIAARRWDSRYKKNILESRVNPTTFLSETLSRLSHPPELFVSASAVGYYGPRPPEEIVDETTGPGTDFLSQVCQAWEAAAESARNAGIRTVCLRLGMVLGQGGGALSRLIPVFNWGLGGPIGNGRQMVSWIALREIPAIIDHLIQTPQLRDPVNAVTPNPLSNREFTRILAKVLHRPAFLPLPSPVVKLIMGEMGETLLLKGAQVLPHKLLHNGYQFQFPDLETTLQMIQTYTPGV